MRDKNYGDRREILGKIQSKSPVRRREFVGSIGAATMFSTTGFIDIDASEFKRKTYTLKSFDGTKLIARIYIPGTGSQDTHIIPNGWNTTKKAARQQANKLVEKGSKVILYDQRGYGRSNGKGKENMNDFTGIKDYQSVVRFFVSKGMIEENPTLEMFY